jgi:hypothetical protein
MATKFSQFTVAAPSGTTEIVGLDGGTNAKFAVNTLDIGSLAGLPLSIGNGGTGQTTQPLALDAITDANNQVANDVLYIDGSGASNVAAFINPSQLPGVPERIGIYAEFQNGTAGGTYFNFPNGGNTDIPFNFSQNWSTSSINSISMNFNGQAGSAGNTTFTLPLSGYYKFTVNLNFFDQTQGLQVKSNLFNVSTTAQKGVIFQRCEANVTIEQMYVGVATQTFTGGDQVQIYAEFSGGTGTPNPFPSTTSANYPGASVLIEYLGQP